MRILALDTTASAGSIALAKDDEVIDIIELNSPDGYAHIVFDEIRKLLLKNSWQVADIDCFAAANGPGAFTGVRVGLTAIKGLAEATGKNVAAVSNLRALAIFGTTGRRAVLIDARRGDVYAGVYDADLRPIAPETVTKLSVWFESLHHDDYEFIAARESGLLEKLIGTRFAQMPSVEAPKALAEAVAKCAWLDASAGKLLSPLAADANYVRRSDAELFWRDR